MSSVMEHRAAVFTGSSQAVEVQRDGYWLTAELLGWRHDGAGACQLRVRCTQDSPAEATWVALEAVRLPESPSIVPVVETPARAMPARALAMPDAAPSADPDATAGLLQVRDGRVRGSATSRTGGRRRAPEGGEPSVAVSPAWTAARAGRHRAPESIPGPAVGRHRAADADDVLPVATSVPGRQPAAPADQSATRAVPAVRPTVPLGRRPVGRGWTPPVGVGSALLTRPMWLGDQPPHTRRSRVGGSGSR